MNDFMEILGALGYLLDTPGAYTRGMIAGRPGERVSGREMLEAYGLGANQEGLDLGDVLGFGADVLVDPLNLMTMPLSGLKAARAASKIGKNRQVAKGIAEGTLIPREQLAQSAYPGPVYRLKPELGAPEEFFTDYLDALRVAEANASGAVRRGTPELAEAFGVDPFELTFKLQDRIYDAAPDMLQKRYIDVRNPIDLQQPLTREQAVRAGTEPADIGAIYKDIYGLETTPEAIADELSARAAADLIVRDNPEIAEPWLIADKITGYSGTYNPYGQFGSFGIPGKRGDIFRNRRTPQVTNEAEAFLFQTPYDRARVAAHLAQENARKSRFGWMGPTPVDESVSKIFKELDNADNAAKQKYLQAYREGGRQPYQGFDMFDPPYGGQAARQLEEGAMDEVIRSMKMEPSEEMIGRYYGIDDRFAEGTLPRDFGAMGVDDYAEYARRLGGDSFVSLPGRTQTRQPLVDYKFTTSPGDMFGVLDKANVYEGIAPAMVNPRMFDAAMYGTGAVGAEALEALYPERGPMEIERRAYPLTMGMMP